MRNVVPFQALFKGLQVFRPQEADLVPPLQIETVAVGPSVSVIVTQGPAKVAK